MIAVVAALGRHALVVGRRPLSCPRGRASPVPPSSPGAPGILLGVLRVAPSSASLPCFPLLPCPFPSAAGSAGGLAAASAVGRGYCDRASVLLAGRFGRPSCLHRWASSNPSVASSLSSPPPGSLCFLRGVLGSLAAPFAPRRHTGKRRNAGGRVSCDCEVHPSLRCWKAAGGGAGSAPVTYGGAGGGATGGVSGAASSDGVASRSVRGGDGLDWLAVVGSSCREPAGAVGATTRRLGAHGCTPRL